ncbi:MAG: hypothetical protein HY243_15710 [Proteobacteria bacterium]|nr:hypothetical protein [Pseudomonadota bacterium]
MSLTDLASLGSFVSGAAVLVSLVYLSLQIRQSTKHSQALIQQGRAARISDTSLRLAELRADDGLDKCFEGSPDVSPKDLARFLFVCRSIFVSAEDSYFQNLQGLLDKVAFESFESSVKAGMASPGIAAGWLMTREMYEPQFRDYLDRTMGDMPGRASPEKRRLANWKAAIAQVTGET